MKSFIRAGEAAATAAAEAVFKRQDYYENLLILPHTHIGLYSFLFYIQGFRFSFLKLAAAAAAAETQTVLL